jgi:hypothetical protein
MALLLLTGCAHSPLVLSLRLPIQRYIASGPIRDSADPGLTFPAIDVFLPSGQFYSRAHSIPDALERAHASSSGHSMPQGFPADTLNDIATRYPELHLNPSRLSGHPTVLVISAQGCHACELQEAPLERADLAGNGVNEVVLTLGSQ